MSAWKLERVMRGRKITSGTHLAAALERYGFGLSHAQISRMRSGKFTLIHTEVLHALCLVLECTPSDLFVFDDLPRPKIAPNRRAVAYERGTMEAEPRRTLTVRPISARIRGLR